MPWLSRNLGEEREGWWGGRNWECYIRESAPILNTYIVGVMLRENYNILGKLHGKKSGNPIKKALS